MTQKVSNRLLERPFRTYNKWSDSQKKEAVKSCLHGEAQSEVMRKYGITTYTVFYRWIDTFGPIIIAEELSMMPKKTKQQPVKSPQSEEEVLKARIATLEQRLEDAELKTKLFEKMIEIAEQDLKISIRKKFAPQQSVGLKQSKK